MSEQEWHIGSEASDREIKVLIAQIETYIRYNHELNISSETHHDDVIFIRNEHTSTGLKVSVTQFGDWIKHRNMASMIRFTIEQNFHRVTNGMMQISLAKAHATPAELEKKIDDAVKRYKDTVAARAKGIQAESELRTASETITAEVRSKFSELLTGLQDEWYRKNAPLGSVDRGVEATLRHGDNIRIRGNDNGTFNVNIAVNIKNVDEATAKRLIGSVIPFLLTRGIPKREIDA